MDRALACMVAIGMMACGAREAGGASASSSGDETAPGEEAGRDVSADTHDAPSSAPADPRMRAIVDAHASRRAAHCAAPLAWSDDLARHAQDWADHIAASGCRLEHSRSAYGENLAAGTTGSLSPEDVVEMWYREREHYRFRGGGFSMQTGHFTQLVWQGSSSIGCGTTTCEGLDVWVCNYDPPGNVEGQYAENVQPTSCR